MTFAELNEDQRIQLKQRILVDRNEAMGEGTSYGELADADELVSDEDLEAWRGYAPNMPSEWINAYDPDHALFDYGIYNLAAIPSLYLLDASKTVLAKDVTDVPYLESLLR